MRVPVSTSDLEYQSGFKRIAKVLSRDWPGTKPLDLSRAREILARAFGYSGYHDVVEAAKTWSPVEAAPSIPQVQNFIGHAIIEVGQGDVAMAISASDLKMLVQSLPLHAISALNALAASGALASPPAAPSSATTPPGATSLMPFSPSLDNKRAFTSKAYRTGARIDQVPPEPGLHAASVLTYSEIQHIVQVVAQHGTLRDCALLALMLSGLRASEIVEIKVEQISVLKQPPGHPLWIATVKTHQAQGPQERTYVINTSLFAPKNGNIIEKYLSSSKLSKGDYLFPSSNNAAQPVTVMRISQIVRRWAVLTTIEPGKISAHTLRRSMNLTMTTNLALDELSGVMGHTPHSPTQGYIRDVQTKTSE